MFLSEVLLFIVHVIWFPPSPNFLFYSIPLYSPILFLFPTLIGGQNFMLADFAWYSVDWFPLPLIKTCHFHYLFFCMNRVYKYLLYTGTKQCQCKLVYSLFKNVHYTRNESLFLRNNFCSILFLFILEGKRQMSKHQVIQGAGNHLLKIIWNGSISSQRWAYQEAITGIIVIWTHSEFTIHSACSPWEGHS